VTHTVPAVAERPAVLLSIDFEDWHQLVHRRLGVADWDRPHAALERQTHEVLDLLDELGARATFFLLGMTVAKHRALAEEIVRHGHDPASHGFAHTRVYDQSPAEFRTDLERSLETVGEAAGRRPLAYRAPAFSINRRTPWAYEILAELGFRYDSSQYDSPRIPNRIGGIPDEPYRLTIGSTDLWELPVSGGGSYWRVLPARMIHARLKNLAVLYLHPYEFGPPLRAQLPPGAGPRARLSAAKLELWRNARRGAVAERLREVARTHRLLAYDQAYDDVDRLYGARTRALSEEGVLL
jgi:peptidoglycan/xylan/chitin deacetylase (PgdA/CDA1 family)